MLLGSPTRCRGIALLCAICVVSLCIPALAAAKVTVPPGATEGDQYFEEVPDGGGSGSVNHGGGGGGAGGGAGGSATASAPVAATQDLDKLGPDGKAAAGLANANRPPELKATNIPSATSSSPTEGDDGMGFWFPLLIIITAVGAIAYGLRRRLMPAQ
jgi:hypothetical protein